MIKSFLWMLCCFIFVSCSSQGVSFFQTDISSNSPVVDSKEYSIYQSKSNSANPSNAIANSDQTQTQLSTQIHPIKHLDSDKIGPENPGIGDKIELKRPVLKIERKKDNQRITQPLRPTTNSVNEISLLIKKDNIDEEEISSLFTSDYIRDFDIPIVFNDAVQYFVRYFSIEKRKVLANWLKRSRRYAPMIKTILREHGLPEDLIYLAMIESGFNPKAYSSMKACGPWQFINETGGRYGLKVNHWVDERRDPEKSTIAAALYLKDLFNQFGNWYLAAAGYNAGEKRIEKAVEKHETTDFWEISKFNTLPRETRDYIPRLLAAAIIAKDPDKFGFVNIDYDEPVRTISEKVPGGVTLSAIARASSIDVSIVRQLNPEILTMITPPDNEKYTIKLPEGVRRDRFHEGFAEAMANEKEIQTVNAYTFKNKDSLRTIIKRYKITQTDLALVNSCDEPIIAKQGKVIFIPSFKIVKDKEKSEKPKTVTAKPVLKQPKLTSHTIIKREKTKKPITRLVYHKVRKGETLSAIADMYNTTPENIKTLNKLKKNIIRFGMMLKISSAKDRIIPARQG
jgi:membrane-bound lytic murein transglycosylase D